MLDEKIDLPNYRRRGSLDSLSLGGPASDKLSLCFKVRKWHERCLGDVKIDSHSGRPSSDARDLLGTLRGREIPREKGSFCSVVVHLAAVAVGLDDRLSEVGRYAGTSNSMTLVTESRDQQITFRDLVLSQFLKPLGGQKGSVLIKKPGSTDVA
jgi:hypothetical protein